LRYRKNSCEHACFVSLRRAAHTELDLSFRYFFVHTGTIRSMNIFLKMPFNTRISSAYLITRYMVIFCLTLSYQANAEKNAPFFSGGMALQSGYISLNTPGGATEGFCRGLGGRLHFYLGNYFRAGTAGAGVSLAYQSPGAAGSTFSLGYGGITLEVSIPRNKWRFSVGVFSGGGSLTHLHIVSRQEEFIDQAILKEYTTFIASPLITVEYRFRESLSFMGMGDYFLGPRFHNRKSLGGPKLHLGVLFNK